jgi:peptide chain release factor subunit 1
LGDEGDPPVSSPPQSEVVDAETIDRITRFRDERAPVLSLYVGVEPGVRSEPRSRVDSLLHEVRAAVDEQEDRVARLSLQADVARLQEIARERRWRPGGVAFFSCDAAGFHEEVELPRQVRDRAIVDADPWIRSMLAVLDELHRCCVVMLDREKARVWELYGKGMREVEAREDPAPRKRSRGGWHGLEEDRTRNRAGELARRHFRRVAASLDSLFRRDRYELLAVGGHQEEIPAFLDFLPQPLRERLAGTFTIDPRTATAGEIKREATEIVDRYEREEEERLVRETLERAAAGERAAVGLEQCLWAGTVTAIGQLLVDEGAVALGVVCDRCGAMALAGETCAVCGEPMREVPDVIDELAEATIEDGGAVEHVVAETDLRQRLTAASLRFPLPPR